MLENSFEIMKSNSNNLIKRKMAIIKDVELKIPHLKLAKIIIWFEKNKYSKEVRNMRSKWKEMIKLK